MFDFDTYLRDKTTEAGWELGKKINDMVEAMNLERNQIMCATYPQDMASEWADNYTPVYNSELLEMAQGNLWLGHGPDDSCYLPEGTTDAYTIIRMAVYEQLQEVASTLIAKWEDEGLDEDAA